jgi:hypothetical protein
MYISPEKNFFIAYSLIALTTSHLNRCHFNKKHFQNKKIIIIVTK